ncbi:MAG: GNAT family N-acetyltransferase [Janthinobacterium lividum]
MIIRKCSSQDIAALEELYYFTQMQTFIARAGKNKLKIGDYQKSTADDDAWVADLDGIVVGFVSIYNKDNFIHNLFVHPKYHNKSIGIVLLKFAENFFTSNDSKGCFG